MHTARAGLPRQTLASVLALWVAALGCEPSPTLAPQSGARQYQQAGFVAVPGGRVNAAGGNLLVERLDHSIDTLLGTWEVRATYDARSGRWLWNFQVRYDGATFLDPSGASHTVGGLADGAPIPGTVWTRADAARIETRGGLGFHFDAQGRLEHVAWRSGAYPRIQYTWTAGSLQMASCSQAVACLPFFEVELDTAGNPLAVIDLRSGRRAEFGYRPDGLLEVARSPLDVAEGRPGQRYEYAGAGGLLTAITSSEGERIEYAWQPGRRIGQVTRVGAGDPCHRFRFLAKDSQGLYTTVHENPLGGRTRYVFDARRRLRRLERSDAGEVTTWSWAGLRPVKRTAPGGAVTRYVYAGDALVAATLPSGNVLQIEYAPGAVNLADPFAAPRARLEDSLGLLEVRSYAADGRLAGVQSGAGETLDFVRGPVALEALRDAAGRQWSFPLYGLHGHWLEVEGAGRDRRAFDPVGNATATSAGRQEGGVLGRSYDADRNLAGLDVAASAAGSVLSQEQVVIAYRSDGQMESVARPQGADHDFVHDAHGRLTELRERVDGVWQATRFEYDPAGNLTARERPNGMREEWQRDVYGRVVRHRALRDGELEGEAVTTWQDGRPLARFDSVRGSTEQYAYDGAGRLQTISFGFGESVTLEYDLRSRRTAESYALPGVGTIRRLEYAYDLSDRLLRLSADGDEILMERVYGDGQLERTRYGNGLERDYQYDATSGQLVAITTRDAAGAIVEQTAIGRGVRQDPLRFAVEAETATTLAATREEYWLGIGGSLGDPDLRVGKRVWHWSDAAGAERDFVYDALGNLRDDASGNVFVYNPEANRLLEATLAASGETHTYAYDAAGFAVARDGLPIEWTATGRLASYADLEIAWDLRGRPLAVTRAERTRSFVFFGGAVDSDPETGALGALDLGVVQLSFGSEARLYRHRDFRGNVGFVSDESGVVVTHYHYSAYGLEATFGSAVDGRTFAGRQQLGALQLLGARVYDPAVGRFLSPDPVFQLQSPYAYAFGNPLAYWDPDGEHPSSAELREARQDAVEDLLGNIVGTVGLVVTVLVVGGGAGGPLVIAAGIWTLYLSYERSVRAQRRYLGARPDSPAGSSFNGFDPPDFGSGPCQARCGPTEHRDAVPGGSSFAIAPGGACAPTRIGALPGLPWALAVLLPLQLALGLAVLRRRRRREGPR